MQSHQPYLTDELQPRYSRVIEVLGACWGVCIPPFPSRSLAYQRAGTRSAEGGSSRRSEESSRCGALKYGG